MKKVLVTGGHGFIGTHLTSFLREAGYSVTTCDVKPPKGSITPSTICNDVSVYLKELQTAENLPALYSGGSTPFNTIIHLAAQPRMGIGVVHPEAVLHNNIRTLVDVLGYCRQHPKTRLIFASSSSVKWSNYDRSPYTLSKLIGEQLIQTYRQTYDLDVTTARLYNVYGPGETDYGQWSTLVHQCKINHHTNSPFCIYGTGEIIRDFTHVADVVNGFWKIMEEKTLQPEYELGMGNGSISVMKIVEAFARGREITFMKSRPWDALITKADANLWPKGWEPTLNVMDYISNWFEAGSPID